MSNRRQRNPDQRVDQHFIQNMRWHILWPVVAASVFALIGLYVVLFA